MGIAVLKSLRVQYNIILEFLVKLVSKEKALEFLFLFQSQDVQQHRPLEASHVFKLDLEFYALTHEDAFKKHKISYANKARIDVSYHPMLTIIGLNSFLFYFR